MEAEIYKCFVASPSDTQEERSVCDKVFDDINRTLGSTLGFRIESKKWESDARPAFASDGQAVINEQLLDDYQLFVGIMWNRFGAPTKRAGSGTEEEFEHAYQKYQTDKTTQIMLYFNDAPTKPSEIDLEQLNQVRQFREKVTDLGALYQVYSGVGEFQSFLKQHLSDYFLSHLGANIKDPEITRQSERRQEATRRESVSLVLRNKLNDALSLFSNQPIVWVDPVISSTNKLTHNLDENTETRVTIDQLIADPISTIIKAPPQFGLTSLSRFIISRAWEKDSIWVYLDARRIRRTDIEKSVKKELGALNLTSRKANCIILDSWSTTEPGSKKLLKTLVHKYKHLPIIVMQTIDDTKFQNEEPHEDIGRNFRVLHLLALPRNKIRKVVSSYNIERNIGDEDVILEKMTKDLEVLNIHRTPLNCLTLLKVAEAYFDESPVNRPKMIEMVLFVLFDLSQLPTYKSKPDLKDCEYVLGRFCEQMMRNGTYNFRVKDFVSQTETFCKEKLIALDVSMVFDILFDNNIIVGRDDLYTFRCSYWIYYFAAKRMHASKEFYEYIVCEKGYAYFPAIVEFFTGIERNRDDILSLLLADMKEACDTVEKKTGLPQELNPFQFAEWTPTKESLAQMKEEIGDSVKDSNLPDSLKDQYADRGYNPMKPYDQSIQRILQEYSLAILIQRTKAASRALRNSDYAETSLKRSLLGEITRAWEIVSKILFAVAPILAQEGYVALEGQSFVLVGDSADVSREETISAIIQANPSNVVRLFADDLFSYKGGPLLYDGLENAPNSLRKHHLALLLICERPKDWKNYVEGYITSIGKNSLYLLDVVNALRIQYKYSFATEQQLREIGYLLKLGFAKHEFGGRKPGLEKVRRISNSVIPRREAEG